MLETGSIIEGKYKILNQVGRGGMSTVYLAINEKANKPWAIKEVRKDGVSNFEVVKQSLIVETDLLKRLNHPNLPSIVDIIDYGDNFLIVMDYVEGVTLNKILQEQGPQDQDMVVDWTLQLCDVLSYLHTRKPPIIYRDMKPSNIMLKSDGTIVLIDFGTAREYKEKNNADTTCLGTKGYAAPEQFGGHNQTDARTDIYTLGATMYHLLTGHNPADPPYEMYPIRYWNPALSGGLENIILKCTMQNPDDRFQSAEELRWALERYRELDKSVMRKYKRRVSLFFAMIVLFIVCTIGTFVCFKKGDDVKTENYNNYIGNADKTKGQDAVDIYMLALETDDTRLEAYEGILNKFIEDGVIDNDESSVLQQIVNSQKGYLTHFKESNPSDYADFCYEVGNDFWYFYANEGERKNVAAPWFRDAYTVYQQTSVEEVKEQRCNMYLEINSIYQKMLHPSPDDTGESYLELWNTFKELKAANDANPDRDVITVGLYYEIVIQTSSNASNMRFAKVELKEIEDMYSDIKSELERIQESPDSNLAPQSAKELYDLMDDAQKMLEAGYSN